jgi:hypothetical protein
VNNLDGVRQVGVWRRMFRFHANAAASVMVRSP